MRTRLGIRLIAIPLAILLVVAGGWWASLGAQEKKESDCVICHRLVTPGIVKDWEASKHSKATVDCGACHGTDHSTPDDIDKVKMPAAADCGICHEDQAKQFGDGKHALAWAAMEAMPRTTHQPAPIVGGLKGCGGCHQIGKNGGKCDSCHTRHLFSADEARNPLACNTCHMGFDHPQYEMWSSSKHGIIYQLQPTTGRAPTCQTCHMDKGNHRVMTAWGFLALRLPEQDDAWMADRATVLKALGVLDPEGKPTPRLDVVKAAKVARLTAEDWQAERDKMTTICRQCHAERYVNDSLGAADQMIRASDRVMAEAITTVAKLYDDKIIQPQPYQPFAYPDVLDFYDAATPPEQELYAMFMEHRMRAFEGAFHMNPDYSHWYGWAPLNTDLVTIRDEAQRMRQAAGK
jgi:Seven times multi-haem cytochrome CxxCH